MAQYDPQKVRGRRPVSEDEPAPVDALLAPASADVERPVGERPVDDADAPAASPTPTPPPSVPARPSVEAGSTSKLPVVIVASIVAALALVLWWWRRRRRFGG